MVATCDVMYNKCYTQQHGQRPSVLPGRNVDTIMIMFVHLVVWTDGRTDRKANFIFM